LSYAHLKVRLDTLVMPAIINGPLTTTTILYIHVVLILLSARNNPCILGHELIWPLGVKFYGYAIMKLMSARRVLPVVPSRFSLYYFNSSGIMIMYRNRLILWPIFNFQTPHILFFQLKQSFFLLNWNMLGNVHFSKRA